MFTHAMAGRELCQRFAALPAPSPAERLVLREGDVSDYLSLAAHHYKASRPATASRVLVLEDVHATVVGRYLRRRGERQTVGALVESYPALNCAMREQALERRYADIADCWARGRALNREMRCISRVVVLPQWRGLGLAVRLVREALVSATTMMTESLAAMGRVNPFFERAGMTAYPRQPHVHDARLTAALRRAGFEPTDLARLDYLITGIDALPKDTRRWLVAELRRWHARVLFSAPRAGDADMRDMLLAARASLVTEPVYYLKVHATEHQSCS